MVTNHNKPKKMIKEIMHRLIPLVTTQVNYVSVWFVAIISIFAPISTLVHAIVFLVLVDNITGIMKSYRRERIIFKILKPTTWKVIKSSKLGGTIQKLIAYIFLILSSFIIDEYIVTGSHTLWVSKITTGAMAFRELVSIIENTEYISGTKLSGLIRKIFTIGIRQTIKDEFKEE